MAKSCFNPVFRASFDACTADTGVIGSDFYLVYFTIGFGVGRMTPPLCSCTEEATTNLDYYYYSVQSDVFDMSSLWSHSCARLSLSNHHYVHHLLE